MAGNLVGHGQIVAKYAVIVSFTVNSFETATIRIKVLTRMPCCYELGILKVTTPSLEIV